MTDADCHLCGHSTLRFYFKDKRREYWQCEHCQLIRVPAEFHLNPQDEKDEYDLHDNHDNDKGYQIFLSRCLDPVLARVSKTAIGLDFGCGEGKVLSLMAKGQGVEMANYDLYYANDGRVLTQQYDFITCTEVIEHIKAAKSTFSQFSQLLNANGVLAIMTKRVNDAEAFSRWHYKNDQTHISFYSIATFEWIAKHYGWELDIVSDDVVLLTSKQSGSNKQ